MTGLFFWRVHIHLIVLGATVVCVSCGLLADGEVSVKRGWNWYDDPAGKTLPEPEDDLAHEPVIPPMERLRKMRPAAVGDLMAAQLSYAIVSEDVGEVAQYYQLLDFVRRRSRAFTALSGVALLQHPQLNARSSYPITNAGRTADSKARKQDRSRRLIAERGEFALVMFSKKSCAYCDVQWGVLQSFRDRTGWTIRRLDIEAYPDRAARMNVQGTPMTILIRRDSEDYFPVAVGAESLPVVADNAYRAIRVLKGEIGLKQFLTDESDDGGFFDPAGTVAGIAHHGD
ncbi:conjugal transfer protein TraF [Eilatimonas milleporae]|uniref:Conjugal transfer pilus assembly protein TraF n=1 Tax=Eilatimonas milleporae TaxID=911205 RepID=A0A3M0CP36_9PROT|nr:conjugal transfer protein TraF [Eilatimonas milleporae]RMB05053.1 conjugal transfer pilus assembly protein TraF [Eilatimonas milleporae]